MERAKLKSYLEVTTNIAVLLVAIVFLSTLADSYFGPGMPTNLEPGLRKSTPFPHISNIDFNSSPQTLIIALNTKCHYCHESLPFYSQLANAQKAGRNNVHIVAVFPNSENEVKQYVQQNNFEVQTIAGVDFTALKVSGTPTIIVVNKTGEVNDFWVGKLSENEEHRVLNVILNPKA